jgi:hypothetical protein
MTFSQLLIREVRSRLTSYNKTYLFNRYKEKFNIDAKLTQIKYRNNIQEANFEIL